MSASCAARPRQLALCPTGSALTGRGWQHRGACPTHLQHLLCDVYLCRVYLCRCMHRVLTAACHSPLRNVHGQKWFQVRKPAVQQREAGRPHLLLSGFAGCPGSRSRTCRTLPLPKTRREHSPSAERQPSLAHQGDQAVRVKQGGNASLPWCVVRHKLVRPPSPPSPPPQPTGRLKSSTLRPAGCAVGQNWRSHVQWHRCCVRETARRTVSCLIAPCPPIPLLSCFKTSRAAHLHLSRAQPP